MEPKNEGLEDVFPFHKGWFSGSMVVFQGVPVPYNLKPYNLGVFNFWTFCPLQNLKNFPHWPIHDVITETHSFQPPVSTMDWKWPGF